MQGFDALLGAGAGFVHFTEKTLKIFESGKDLNFIVGHPVNRQRFALNFLTPILTAQFGDAPVQFGQSLGRFGNLALQFADALFQFFQILLTPDLFSFKQSHASSAHAVRSAGQSSRAA